MNRLLASQVENNRLTKEAWGSFAAHRERVSDLIAGAANAAGRQRVCILGAGNCNDVDLKHLLAAFREVHLVDIDASALAQGIARQGLAGHPALMLHGNVDLTGVLEAADWPGEGDRDDENIAAAIARPVAHVAPLLPGPFDVVASVCVLSQLIDGMVSTIGVDHPRFVEYLQAVRLGHLRLISALAAPGGTGVFVSDLVSSETLPDLATVPEAELPELLARAIAARNFFHGVNPEPLVQQLATDAVLRAELEPPFMLRPWLWDLGLRLYAVWAFTARRR